MFVSGGSRLDPSLFDKFYRMGFPVYEGYGLTETSPVLTSNRLEIEQRRIGTVGPPLPGVEIKIAEDGEILAKGPNIMMGYYKRQDLTDEVMDKDGWFHTGDIGEFVEGEFLKITDRKKELFKTSGGKYVAPQQVENKYKESMANPMAMGRLIPQLIGGAKQHNVSCRGWAAASRLDAYPNSIRAREIRRQRYEVHRRVKRIERTYSNRPIC